MLPVFCSIFKEGWTRFGEKSTPTRLPCLPTERRGKSRHRIWLAFDSDCRVQTRSLFFSTPCRVLESTWRPFLYLASLGCHSCLTSRPTDLFYILFPLTHFWLKVRVCVKAIVVVSFLPLHHSLKLLHPFCDLCLSVSKLPIFIFPSLDLSFSLLITSHSNGFLLLLLLLSKTNSNFFRVCFRVYITTKSNSLLPNIVLLFSRLIYHSNPTLTSAQYNILCEDRPFFFE